MNHICLMRKEQKELDSHPEWLMGNAIDRCEETEEGTLYVDNGEYTTQVDFCPFCGFKAKTKVIFEAPPASTEPSRP